MLMQLVNSGTKFPLKLGMLWHSRKTHSDPDLSHHFSELACQISGRNFFQVGDDVTTRISRALSLCLDATCMSM
ncbi:hypothetical protein Hanom_Chr02g00123061 [Helianthus anomalus]